MERRLRQSRSVLRVGPPVYQPPSVLRLAAPNGDADGTAVHCTPLPVAPPRTGTSCGGDCPRGVRRADLAFISFLRAVRRMVVSALPAACVPGNAGHGGAWILVIGR